ncbi:MAG: TonB-dependent receptor [Gammaproteobacteria bacterium]
MLMASAAVPLIAAADDAAAPELEEVAVTGTRIVRDGYQAPTPVSVLGVEQIQSFASPNIADAVNTLPVFSGSTSPASTQTTVSTGNSNINALNLRALGTQRTLVLVDGQRSVGSSLSGLVDVNLIPQDLVSRVDVVTGGASAVYGSDALGGVVNFVLDRNFTGLKAQAQYGATTHGDGDNWDVSATFGTAFAGGRGHFIFSASGMHTDPIPINRRDWNLTGWQFINNPGYTATNGQPRRLLLSQVALSNGISGGIITDTALKGTAFGAGGVPYQFHYGDIVADPDMRGGDWKLSQVQGTRAGQALGSLDDNESVFMRASFDVTDDVNVFFQAARAHDSNYNYAFSLEDTGTIALKSDNAFIPASVKSALDAAGITSFHMGSMHPDLGIGSADNDRTVTRLVLGASGKIMGDWNWDAYAQHGISDLINRGPHVISLANYARALDAVVNPANGQIVCRSTLNGTDPTGRCVPYNPMGIGVNTQAAVNYVEGDGQTMWRKQQLTQDVAAATLRGNPFSTWAGPVSLAGGLEWRKEWVGNGANDPLSNTFGWWVGGYPATQGSYNVKEGFLETVVPLAKDLPGIESLDFSGAVRETDYSTSGAVTTWKAGLTYTPIDDIKVRATLSRDIRAPNLEELFSKGSGGAPAVVNPWVLDAITHLPITENISSPRLGNPLLNPEEAKDLGFGVVLQPRFIPNFAMSVDYWSIDIDQAIGLTTTQDIIDRCFEGNTSFCSAIDYKPGTMNIAVVRRSPFNYVNQKARGVDFEASYALNLGELSDSLQGHVSMRAMATNYLENSTADGVLARFDTAGQNTSFGPPSWKWTAILGYSLEPVHVSLTARGVSDGKYDNRFIECDTGCPASVSPNFTVTDNHIPSTVVFDTSVNYAFSLSGGAKLEAFLNVRNLPGPRSADRCPASGRLQLTRSRRRIRFCTTCSAGRTRWASA